MKRIDADNNHLVYSGRIDFRDPKSPVFVYPCTNVRMRFRGDRLKILLRNRHEYWKNFAGILADGKQMKFSLNETGETVLEIPLDEQREEHEVMLFKRQDGCHYFAFQGIWLDENAELLAAPELPGRRIEVFGDSVSAGELSEAVDYTGKEDPQHEGEYSNSWYSYSWTTARLLGAELHDIAQGGMALLDGSGWYHEPDAEGMVSVWDKIEYNPVLGEIVPWDFSKWIPDVVIVALGQNDSHPIDYMAEHPDGPKAQAWKDGYYHFLEKLRKVYPKAQIVCITTLLIHDPAWDRAITETVDRFRSDNKDEKLTQYLFRRNGCGTPGHLRITEGREMAEELARYLEKLSIRGW